MDLVVKRVGDGWQARYGDKAWKAAVGRGGIRAEKVEGDGVSPIGCWPIRKVFYRADKLDAAPVSVFETVAIDAQDGWCDAPDHRDYNRQVRLPFDASHEEMWRADGLYDIVVVLGQNDDPVVPGAGSAIFLHVASENYGPTAGCAALTLEDLREFLAMARPGTRLCFTG
ncbi:L,D-transpeptidase family protein [Rhizobium sp. YJ-22]|uniref:L,D-transpeptidase family protein n=1 Tax=Rhizobium sp. YJ-22 TaxID=3037556 RepID=UPI002412ABEA|nr:L,D-transpeptidase family protein [Rhizobium sp. YJ-22]MDG3579583.1 L,D-transpeptidase family protein [Rhizobium sp. YJ-22]